MFCTYLVCELMWLYRRRVTGLAYFSLSSSSSPSSSSTEEANGGVVFDQRTKAVMATNHITTDNVKAKVRFGRGTKTLFDHR